MQKLLDQHFINSIVEVNKFQFDFSFKSLSLDVLCIVGADTEVNYTIKLSNIASFYFTQEDFESEFSIIDTFLEKFNESPEMIYRKSEDMNDFWVLRFHSGIHQIVVAFKGLTLHSM